MYQSPFRRHLGAIPWLLAAALIFALPGCESDSETNEPDSEQQAGIESADAVGSALDNALDANDENSTTLRGNGGFVDTLSGLTRDLPGLGGGVGEPSGDPATQASGSYTGTVKDISGTYACEGGGTVDLTASATWTADWDDGGGGSSARYWHEDYTLTDVTFTLTDCSEDGYTLNGTAVFNANNSVDFDETGVATGIFDILLIIDEDATANVTALQEATGTLYTFDMAWALDATMAGVVDINAGTSELTAVDATATYTVNDWTCTGTWTNPDKEPNISCSNN